MTWDDFDREAKTIQHERAYEFDKIVCRRVFNALDVARRITGVKIVDTFMLEKLKGFDSRPLGLVFHLMAPYWRFVLGLRYPRLPGIGPTAEQLEADWYAWLHREMDRLCTEPCFMRPFVEASIYYDTEIGFDAEQALEFFLRGRYSEMWRKEKVALPTG